jgi:hypothetical protein
MDVDWKVPIAGKNVIGCVGTIAKGKVLVFL